jgi:predicted metal-dependent HD superfamily phosphohydrolase
MLMGYLRKVKDLLKPQAMNQSNLLHAVNDFVFSLFLAEPKPELLYHNYKHTADVVAGIIKLAAAHQLSAADTEILALAAWFHDTGFLQQSAGHEVKSVSIAKKYLASQNCNEATIDLVASCIEATALGFTPKTLLQQIIKDADTLAVGSEDYFTTSELLREEKRQLNGVEIDDIEWLR